MILIIGAGVAGLSCAQELIKKGLKVRIFEASDRYGGRVKPLFGFSKRHLEAGGQTIHHHDNNYFRMAQELGANLEKGGDLIGTIYDPIQKKVIRFEEFTTLYKKESEVIENMIQERNIEDEPVLDRLKKNGYNLEFIHYFNALFGSEYGASLSKISSKGVGSYEFDMPLFVSDYEIQSNLHHKDIFDKYFAQAIEQIEYNMFVTDIEVINNQVFVTVNEEKIQFDKVVCCVPITQVKKIKFNPQFDQNRQNQLNLVGMEQGGKFFIKIDKEFLDQDVDFFIPKFDHNSLWWDNSSDEEQIIIGLLGQDAHNKVIQIGEQQFAQEIINTINQQYNVDLNMISYHYENWGCTKYIEGLYSFPQVGLCDNYRDIISQPHCDLIYFAGEAYHPKYYSTIHGAYETGIKIAQNYF